MKCNIKAFTLLELLIAISISICLLSTLFKIIIQHKNNVATIMAQLKLLDAADKFLLRFTSDIKQAGYIGCAKLTDDFPIQSLTEESITPKNYLLGTKEALTVRYASTHFDNLIASNLLLTNRNNFKSKMSLFIADCQHAAIIKPKRIMKQNAAQLLILDKPLTLPFSDQAEISQFMQLTYSFNKKEHTILFKSNQDRAQILLNHVYEFALRYDYKTDLLTGVSIYLQLRNKKANISKYDYVAIA